MSDVEWRAIPGYEGHYEVSIDGQVRSLDRRDRLNRPLRGTVLRPTFHKAGGYPMFGLKRDTHRVLVCAHKVVTLAFLGPRDEGQVVRHLDGDPSNNHVSNLAYGTVGENMHDTVRHGRNVMAKKTHCLRGHEFSNDNTLRRSDGGRECRRCIPIRVQERRARQVAA